MTVLKKYNSVSGLWQPVQVGVPGENSTVPGPTGPTGPTGPQPTLVAATTSVSGIVELATAAETLTGTDSTRAVTPVGLSPLHVGYRLVEILYITEDTDFIKANYPWLRAIRVHTLGGGGAGGGAQSTTSLQAADAGGGGSGTYATAFITNISALAITATVGRGNGGTPGEVGNFNGGDGQQSFFSNLCSSQGGGGGSGGGASASFSRSSGGFAGDAGVGDFIVQGSDGGNGFVADAAASRQGVGAAAPGPYGAGLRRLTGFGAGSAGKIPGGGGTGAANGSSSSAVSGGAGADGIVVLELYA